MPTQNFLKSFLVATLILFCPKTTLADEATALLDKLETRSPVITGLRNWAAITVGIPPQYLICIHALHADVSRTGSDNSRSNFLNEIDFLNDTGLNPEQIVGLFYYGQGLLDAQYFLSTGKKLGEISTDDIQGLSNFRRSMFQSKTCSSLFSPESSPFREFLRETIRSALAT